MHNELNKIRNLEEEQELKLNFQHLKNLPPPPEVKINQQKQSKLQERI